jgi:hypothetical protein
MTATQVPVASTYSNGPPDPAWLLRGRASQLCGWPITRCTPRFRSTTRLHPSSGLPAPDSGSSPLQSTSRNPASGINEARRGTYSSAADRAIHWSLPRAAGCCSTACPGGPGSSSGQCHGADDRYRESPEGPGGNSTCRSTGAKLVPVGWLAICSYTEKGCSDRTGVALAPARPAQPAMRWPRRGGCIGSG